MELPSKRTFILLISLGALTELSYLMFIFLNGSGNIPLYMYVYFQAFLLFFAAWFLLTKTSGFIYPSKLSPLLKKITGAANDENASKIKVALVIILLGIIFRVTLIPAAPATSPDVYRYMFEGRTTLSGSNPYIDTPQSESLVKIRDENFNKVAFKNLPAIYPPAAQFIFALSQYVTPGSYISMKIIFLLFEAVTMIFLLKLLLLKRKEPWLVLLYAWLPLPVMEYFVNAHIDAAGISFLLIFLYYIEKQEVLKSSIPFALAVLIKLYPLMLMPLLLKKIRIKELLHFSLILAGIIIIFYLPFIYKNIYVVESLVKYIQNWEFNGSVYNLVKSFSNGLVSRRVCGALLIITIAVISWRYRDFTKGSFSVYLAYVIFATTLYPWYLGWLAALNPFAGFTSAMSLFFTSNFSNFTPMGKEWKEYLAVLLVQYIPFFILLGFDIAKRFRIKITVSGD